MGAGTGGETGALACRIATLPGPTLSVTVRSAPVFGLATTWIVAVPVPDEGVRVTHEASGAAVHGHVPDVRTSTAAAPPEAASIPAGPDSVY
jgi:hypothetical protein